MKEIFFKFFILSFIIIGISFYFLSFFVSKTIVIESSNLKTFIDGETKIAPIKEESAYYLKDFSYTREDLISTETSFSEINLQEMKAKIYQEGILKETIPISARGDVQEWGGTPSGLYYIISKNKLAFSIVSEVYMPWAIHFYGLYYLHGVPYYPGGDRRITGITGGCIQFSDKDAQVIYNLTEEGMPVLVIDKENDGYKYPSQRINEFPEISAKSYLVADLDSGFVFAQKNSEEKLPIASLAKLMTAVVVAENIDRRKSILVEPKMLKTYGSTQKLEAGKSFRFVELLYPLLIESSNDAAEVLSYFLGRDKTIKLMNEKTKSILMEKTKFNDPSGLDLGNTSTAKDIFYLARYISSNYPLLLGITRGDDVRAFGEVRFKNLHNKNIFFDNSDFLGGKTGAAVNKSYNGLFIFRLPLDENGAERRIAIILLGSDGLENDVRSIKKDSEQILDWLQENYFIQNQKLYP